jgi:hypothetical protein
MQRGEYTLNTRRAWVGEAEIGGERKRVGFGCVD